MVDHFDSPNWSKAKQSSHIWQTAPTSGLCISSLHGRLPQGLIAYLGDMRRDELQTLHSGEEDGEQVHVRRSDGQGRKCHSLTKRQTVKKLCVLLRLRTFWGSLSFNLLLRCLQSGLGAERGGSSGFQSSTKKNEPKVN